MITAAEYDALRHCAQALDRIYVEEINGRVCPLPDSEDVRCCVRCREHWRLTREALRAWWDLS